MTDRRQNQQTATTSAVTDEAVSVAPELSAVALPKTDRALPESGSEGVNGVDRDLTVHDNLMVVDDLDRVRLFGLELVNATDLEPVIHEMLNGPRRDDGGVVPAVLTPNVDIIVHLDQTPDSPEAELYPRAQYCLPDGQPLVMASRLFGKPLKARLPGSELFHLIWPRVAADRIPTVVVASSDDIAGLLREQHPKASYIVPPYFDADDPKQVDAVVSDVLTSAQAVRPSLVFVGIGNPKDARIISALFERWDPKLGPKPLCFGLGGSFLMHLGLKKRAPKFVQRIGMEWFFRFAQEPRRLFHRYFVRDLAFFGIAGREWRASRSGKSSG